mmetsp:Transcript_61850/g.135452  ORF Transcript_61850/g.135452 Transcript_61850/m.135452 type:complete len:239 (+) Transcript_61850:28-744(+)
MAGSNWNPGCSNGGPASPNSILARGLQSGNPKSHPPIDGLRVGKSMRHPQFLKKSKYVLSHRQHQTNMENNFAVAILSQSLGHLATVAGERRAQAAAWASNRSCAPDPSVLRNLCRGNTACTWDLCGWPAWPTSGGHTQCIPPPAHRAPHCWRKRDATAHVWTISINTTDRYSRRPRPNSRTLPPSCRNTPRDLGIPIAVSAAAWPSSRTTIPHRCRGPFFRSVIANMCKSRSGRRSE